MAAPTSLDHSDLASLVSFLSLLIQFPHPQVRADFINHQFWININLNLLPKIDDLHWSLLLHWQRSIIGQNTTSTRSQVAAHHLSQLLCKIDELLFIDTDAISDCLTYRQWSDTISHCRSL
jgi:hypothetical protein